MGLIGEFLLFVFIAFRVWIFFGIVFVVIGLFIGGTDKAEQYLHDYFVTLPRKLFR